jgi:predicted RNA-binding Zn ribbon-like protein
VPAEETPAIVSTIAASPQREPAPAPLNLIEDFVNTSEIDGVQRDELLPTPDAWRAWLVERELIGPEAPFTEQDQARAAEVREDLRALLLANNGEALEPAVVERLNDIARHAVLTVRFQADGHARLEPESTGIDGALGRILAVVFASISDGSWSRLKACRNDECMWVFYDSSKNHSATWCSMRVCGNRMKARAYRRRQSADA